MAELGGLLLYRPWTAFFIATNIPVLVMRARREEKALSAEFGEKRDQCPREVPAWIPRLRG